MPKVRSHNEWFMPVQKADGKTRCPCGLSRADRIRKGDDSSLYAWGEYANAKWRTIDYFCQDCFSHRILTRLLAHTQPCGCSVNFNPRSGYALPAWIKSGEASCNLKKAA